MVAIEDERTASSSRRSAKLRERSRGSDSRVWVYSERRDSEYAVSRLLLEALDVEALGAGMVELVVDDGEQEVSDFYFCAAL